MSCIEVRRNLKTKSSIQELKLYELLTQPSVAGNPNQVWQAIEDNLCLKTFNIIFVLFTSTFFVWQCLAMFRSSFILDLITHVRPSQVLCMSITKFKFNHRINFQQLGFAY